MASEPFKSTLRQQEKNRVVRAAMTSHRPEMLVRAGELYQSVLREGETFDWDFFYELNVRLMNEVYQQLLAADQAQRVDEAEGVALTKFLAGRASRTRRHVRSVKNSFAGSYGDVVLALLGLDGTFASKALTLLGQGRFVETKLRDTTIVLPDPLPARPALEREVFADELQTELDGLETVLNQVDQERKEIQQSRAARRETERLFRRRHVNLTRVFESYLRLLGLDDLADRLRLTISRRSRRASGESAGDTATEPASPPAQEPASPPAEEPVSETP